MRNVLTALVTLAFLGCGGLAPGEPAPQTDDSTLEAQQQQAVSGQTQAVAPPEGMPEPPLPNDELEATPAWPPADGLFRQTKDRKEEHFFYPVKIRPAPPTSTPQCPPCT